VPELDGVLVVRDFTGMQAAIDMNDGLGLLCECMRLLVGDAARDRQATRDVLIVIQLGEVFRIGDEGDEPVAPLRGLANVDQLDSLRGGAALSRLCSSRRS